MTPPDTHAGTDPGAPAGPPGEPRLALALVATVRSRLGTAPRDDLAGPASLAAWLADRGLVTDPPPDETHVRQFRALREAAYRLLEAVAHGDAPRAADVRLVNRSTATPAPAAELAVTDGSELVLRSNEPAPEQVLGTIARDLAELLTGPQRERVRQCEADICGTFYLDASRAGTRRWCSSTTCGNRARVASHRNR